MKEYTVVGFVEEKASAIDYTPIYYIRTSKAIKSGTLLRFDAGEIKITKEE